MRMGSHGSGQRLALAPCLQWGPCAGGLEVRVPAVLGAEWREGLSHAAAGGQATCLLCGMREESQAPCALYRDF